MADVEAIVIGAGPAGLASVACLEQHGISTLILERANDVGASWRRHYDRLHLHTDKRRSALPFLPYPASYPRYPSRDQVISYLEAYASRFRIAPRFGEEVLLAKRGRGLWQVTTTRREYAAPFLVVASGQCRVPVTPHWPGQDSFAGSIEHSSAYTSGRRFRGQRVLVVGSGNSGAEIALDLHEQGARPTLAVRGPFSVVTRELFGIPLLALAIPLDRLPPRLADAFTAPLMRLSLGDLRRYGIPLAATGPFSQVANRRRVPLIDVGTIDLLRTGALPLRGGIDRFEADSVIFSDGAREEFDAVVLATGYRHGLEEFLTLPGTAVERPGATYFERSQLEQFTEHGLFLCGFDVVPTGMLRQIGREATSLAERIANHRTPLTA